MAVKSVVVMAGGTGGHVFPALAVAMQLREQGIAVHWLGTAAGIEAEVVPRHELPITFLDVSGVRGQGMRRLLLAPFKIATATLSAMRVMQAVKADCVIGLGGYVTGPGGLAARMLGKPLVIHEQNAVAGFTNGLLSHLASRVLQAFPNAFPASPKVATTGNPVRPEISAVEPPGQRFLGRSGPLRVLVLGGSQGAVALNTLLPQAMALIPVAQRPQVRHQTGRKSVDVTRDNYLKAGVEVDVLPFIDDMAAAYAWADLVICRSGALTVSELASAGAASVLVPYPFAVDDHQTANARYLSDAGAAILCPQKDLTPEALASTLLSVWRRETLLEMAVKARELAKPEATTVVAEYCLQY